MLEGFSAPRRLCGEFDDGYWINLYDCPRHELAGIFCCFLTNKQPKTPFFVISLPRIKTKREMTKKDIQGLRDSGRIIHEYVRGSHLYGLNVETSDRDTGGVYLADTREVLGLGLDYCEQVGDSKQDTVFYELGRFCHLVMTSNPTVLEALWCPEDMWLARPSEAMTRLIDNRERFLSKKIFNALGGYAVSQIKKARGLNKKIVNPVLERKGILDFCHTRWKQGSTPILRFLERNGLRQEYCGLVNLPNMHDVYGVYYDWGAHYRDLYRKNGVNAHDVMTEWMETVKEDPVPSDKEKWTERARFFDSFVRWGDVPLVMAAAPDAELECRKPIGYRGMVKDDENESTQLRMSSVEKDQTPVCDMAYNMSGFTKHCKDYLEYKEWEANRNPARYESNLRSNYDRKNMMHCVRLLHMALEAARGEGLQLRRTWDRDMLMEIRTGNVEYDELIAYIEEKKRELDALREKCRLPEDIDVRLLDRLLKEARLDDLR